jgi:MFS family permease
LQGFSGGTLIPLVFSAVFLLFPVRLQTLATMIAGVLAVLAPTVGPVVGGWITETFSWHWLFLINVLPGAVAALAASVTLPNGQTSFDEARHLDVISLALGAVALAALEIAIKEAPKQGWTSPVSAGLSLLVPDHRGSICSPDPARGETVGEPAHLSRPKFCDWLSAQLCPRHGPLRIDLSDARLSRSARSCW